MTIDRLLAIMARLRDPETGCEWDRAQTSATIAPYTIEEAYEVADAIARGDIGDLKDELGDLLLQVVFHSRIAEEAGAVRVRRRRDRHRRQDGAPPPAYLRRRDGGHHLLGSRSRPRNAPAKADARRAGRRRARPAGAAPRGEAAEARGAGRLRLARRRRPARQDRRGNGRDRDAAAATRPSRGSRRPAVRGGQLGAASRRSMPKRRCAARMRSSSGGFARWRLRAGGSFAGL